MKQVLIALLISLALASCSTSRQIKKCEKCFNQFSDTSIVIKDSLSITFDTITYYVKVPADTSIQIIKIVCDSTGKATIVNKTTTNGNRSILNSSIKDNTLTIQSTCLAYLDSIKTLNTTINKFKSEQSTVFVPKLVEANLNWWQKIKIRFGGWAFLIIALYIGYKGLKTYYKVNTPMGLLLTIRRKLLH
jgi:hypothetical protein